MIKKRIAGAVVVKNNRVVQSFEYGKYLPIGSVNSVVQNLDRWSVDEIIILDIDRSKNNLGPNLELLKDICSIPISTPLTYAGGINSVNDAINVVGSGAERIILDNLLINNHIKIKQISNAIGSQAIIISLPIKIIDNEVLHFDYLENKTIKLDYRKLKELEGYVSEIMLIDVDSEGTEGLFRINLVENFLDINLNLICFGGISTSKKGSELLNNDKVNAVVYGNVLNYGELFFQKIKKSLIQSKKQLRRSIYREKI